MTLKFGDGKRTNKYDQVFQLQKVLTTLGFMPGKIDGEYGNNTASAVAEFQAHYGLATTGMVDDNTYSAMKKALVGEISPVQKPIMMRTPIRTSEDIMQVQSSNYTYWIAGFAATAFIIYMLAKK